MPRTTHLLAALLALAAAAPLAAGEEEVLLKFKLQLTYESVRNFKNGFMVQAVSETLGVEASKVVVEFPSPPPAPPPPPPPPGALNATNTTNTTELANTTNTTESANTTNTTAEYDQPSAGFGRKLLQPREIVPGIELVVSVMVQTSNIKAFTDTLNKALFSETIQAKYEKLVFDSTQETILFNLALGESENYNQRAARDATATALGVALPRVNATLIENAARSAEVTVTVLNTQYNATKDRIDTLLANGALKTAYIALARLVPLNFVVTLEYVSAGDLKASALSKTMSEKLSVDMSRITVNNGTLNSQGALEVPCSISIEVFRYDAVDRDIQDELIKSGFT